MKEDKKSIHQQDLDARFWNEKWEEMNTGWDIGYVSPPIENYLQTLTNKESKILIPGCGNAYEAEFLLQKGFENITIIDIAPKAVDILKEKFKKTPVKVLCEDFFQHQEKYDLVIEQTFFCAISPEKRKAYVQKMKDVLETKGQIVGLLFNTIFEKQGPPFGGNIAEYKTLFQDDFSIKTMETCYNSIAPRAGKEVFIQLIKK